MEDEYVAPHEYVIFTTTILVITISITAFFTNNFNNYIVVVAAANIYLLCYCVQNYLQNFDNFCFVCANFAKMIIMIEYGEHLIVSYCSVK